jgi:hypothetical protein
MWNSNLDWIKKLPYGMAACLPTHLGGAGFPSPPPGSKPEFIAARKPSKAQLIMAHFIKDMPSESLPEYQEMMKLLKYRRDPAYLHMFMDHDMAIRKLSGSANPVPLEDLELHGRTQQIAGWSDDHSQFYELGFNYDINRFRSRLEVSPQSLTTFYPFGVDLAHDADASAGMDARELKLFMDNHNKVSEKRYRYLHSRLRHRAWKSGRGPITESEITSEPPALGWLPI